MRKGIVVRLRARIGALIFLAACARVGGARHNAADIRLAASLGDTLSYRTFVTPPGEQAERDVGSGRVETRAQSIDGHERLLQFREIVSSRGTFRDTLVAESSSLAPTSEITTFGGKRTQYRYDGARVEIYAVFPDGTDSTRVHVYDTPVYSFNQVDQLARTVPLREGYRRTLPLYSQGDDALEMDTLTVLGPDSTQVWKVQFADKVLVETYGVDAATRKIVRYEVRVRKTGLRGRWAITRP